MQVVLSTTCIKCINFKKDVLTCNVKIYIQEDGEYVIVESGLNANDVVMKNPTSETKEGVKVE